MLRIQIVLRNEKRLRLSQNDKNKQKINIDQHSLCQRLIILICLCKLKTYKFLCYLTLFLQLINQTLYLKLSSKWINLNQQIPLLLLNFDYLMTTIGLSTYLNQTFHKDKLIKVNKSQYQKEYKVANRLLQIQIVLIQIPIIQMKVYLQQALKTTNSQFFTNLSMFYNKRLK